MKLIYKKMTSDYKTKEKHLIKNIINTQQISDFFNKNNQKLIQSKKI